MLRRLIPALVVVGAVAQPAHAVDPVASFRYLVTGNGFGFQVYDQSANAIKQYLERPYRYLRANPANPDGEGIVRRNLAFDTYFGIKAGTTTQWLGSVTPTLIEYENQTNIIHTTSTVGGVSAETYLVAPFGYEGNALVMLLKVTNTTGSAVPVTAFAIHNFKLGSASNPDVPDANGEAINWNGTVATETGPGGGAMVYAPIGGADVSSCDPNAYTTVQGGGTLTMLASCSGTDQKNAEQKNLGSLAAGATAWWGVAVLFDSGGDSAGTATKWATFLNGRAADKLHDDLLAEMGHVSHGAARRPDDAETKVWRQAEAVLRMGQILEPYLDSPRQKNHGMILASLPPGGWHTGWVRDANVRDHRVRAHRSRRSREGLAELLPRRGCRPVRQLLEQRAVSDLDGALLGDGQEEADYSGSTTRNIEIDGWGLFLWAARQYVDASNDAGWLAETTKQGDTVYDAIERRRRAARGEHGDVGDHDRRHVDLGGPLGNRQHFMYTTAATARGFCDMATLARRAGRMDDVTRYRDLATKTATALAGAFVDSNNVLAGSLEKLQSGTNYHDGSTIEAVTFGVLAADTMRPRPRPSTGSRTWYAGGRIQAARGLAGHVRHQRVDPDRPARQRCVPPRGPDREGRLAARVGEQPGVGELQPVARALQHGVVGRRDRVVRGIDPDGRLWRRRVHADAARSRGLVRAHGLRRVRFGRLSRCRRRRWARRRLG